MALKRLVDSIDQVPEAFRELYKEETNGKFRLDAEPDSGEELQRANSHLKKEIATHKAAVDEYRAKYGNIDPDEYARLKTEAEERERKKAEEAGNYEAVTRQIQEKAQKEIEARDRIIADHESTFGQTIIERDAIDAISKAGGISELLMPHVLRRLKPVKSDNRFHTRVIDENGQERISPRSDSNAHMAVSELVEEMRENPVFARCFNGSSASGGGATQNGNGGAGAGVRTKSDLKSREAKSAYIDKHGFAAFDALPLQ